MILPGKMVKNHEFESGFTLFELLIAIGIFLLVAAMTFVSFRSGQYRDQLTGAAQLIQAALREAQTATFSGMTVSCPDPSNPANPPVVGEPLGGYGLHFTTTTTPELYANCTGSANRFVASSASFPVLRTVDFSPKVNVAALSAGDAGGLDITFSKNEEGVFVNTDNTYNTNVVVSLEHQITSSFMYVKINPITGQVFVDTNP